MSTQIPADPSASGNTPGVPPVIDDPEQLKAFLGDSAKEGQVVRTRLRAGERVIARVTDGIYREPASALRELISNAWDADAKLVTIQTDAPRFSRITISDDGSGMSYEMLARLVHNIGDSAKRTAEGQDLGVTAEDDPERTQGGRLLIGKIGIGLFSVSQLATRFRIITKRRGASYRLVAEVSLRTYSDETGEDAVQDEGDYIAADVSIRRDHAEDIESHGTDVVLENVKSEVRNILRSNGRWTALEEKERVVEAGSTDDWVDLRLEPPQFHVGWIRDITGDPSKPAVLTVHPKLPWAANDPPETRMGLLMAAVENESSRTARPDLAKTLDTYLRTLWTLALSSPVRYVESHPFDLTSESGIQLFWLANEPRRQAVPVTLEPGMTVRDAVREQVPGSPVLEDGLDAAEGGFRVIVDGVELRRPIRFRPGRKELKGWNIPLLFVGKYTPDLARIDPTRRGGDLSWEGYLFWNTGIVPKENNGVLVRIRGASGALFDPTFFNYQVSEQTRLKQITSELFVERGLDPALNIDRESFNFAHPHVVFVKAWLHRAIRQLTNKHKDLGQRLRDEHRAVAAAEFQDVLVRHSANVWASLHGTEPAPEVTIASDPMSAQFARSEGYIALDRARIRPLAAAPASSRQERDAKARALVRVLAAYGALAERPFAEQEALVEAILAIFFEPHE